MSEGYGKGGSGFGLTRDQSVEMIVRTCIDNGVTDHRQIAYVLATAQHESRDFAAPEEDWGRKQAVDLRYFGGEEYFGRGFAHLTHVNNYERLGEALGMGRELVEHPERAAQADIATKVLVVGCAMACSVRGCPTTSTPTMPTTGRRGPRSMAVS